MNPLSFTANLCTEDGQFIETGEARVSDTESSVDFTGEFVPLLKLGVTVQIVRVLGSSQFERFTGKVYLSSRKLLKIVEVDEQLVKKARSYFSVNENLPVTLLLAPEKPARFNPQKAARISGVVRGIYSDTIKITSIDFIPDGQRMMLSVESESITLDSVMLCVRERVLMRRSAAILLCDIESASDESRRAIADFLARQPSL